MMLFLLHSHAVMMLLIHPRTMMIFLQPHVVVDDVVVIDFILTDLYDVVVIAFILTDVDVLGSNSMM
jgi:hypothetical protein